MGATGDVHLNDTGMLSVNQFVTYDRGGMWAIKAYKPKRTHYHHIGNYLSREKKENFMLQLAKKKQSIPAPN